MFTLKEAAKHLGISIDSLESHLDLKSGRGYVYRDEKGNQLIHDGDVERIVMRLSYAKELDAEKKALLERHNVATIDM